MNAPITQAWRNIARRLPVIANAPTPREPQTAPSKYEESALLRLSDDGDLLDPRHSDELPEGVFGYLLGSPQDEANQVAQLLLEDYLYRGAAYARSAIIVRSGTEVARFRRVLAASGIPTVTGAALVPVRDEPAVRPFLDALSLLVYARQQSADYLKLPDHNDFDGSLTENISPEAVTEAGTRSADDEAEKLARQSLADVLAEENRTNPGSGAHNAITLLTSRLGGASSMEVRRLRQQLRAAELRAGGHRCSDDLLLGALLNPQALPAQGIGAAVRRAARALAAG